MRVCVFCEHQNTATESQCQSCAATLPSGESQQLDEVAFQAQVLTLLDQGEKAQAIAARRRHSNCSLTAATEYVEGLNRDVQFTSARPIADVEREVSKLLVRCEKANAIKVFQEMTGCSMKQAQDEIKALEGRLGLMPEDDIPKKGCARMVLVLVSSAALAMAVV